MLYYFKKGKNTTETHKKINAVHGEGSVKSGSRSFLVLLTLWPNNSLLWGCVCIGRCLAAPLDPTHWKPIAGDSRHTQNIQINKVTGENEKMCLLF